jgi:hypothetical protein
MREKHCWLVENKGLKAQANRLLVNQLGDEQTKEDCYVPKVHDIWVIIL